MFKFIIPSILIGVSVAGFFIFIDPMYKGVDVLKQEMTSYDEALNNSKVLEQEKEVLTQKYNLIGAENLDKLQKLLPSSVDNIRLVLEIEKIALAYGMSLKDVRYDAIQSAPSTAVGGLGGGTRNLSRDYETLNLEFATEGTYSNFLSFIKSLEKNLRIIDISSITFSSSSGSSLQDVYKYTFKIKTYWLKN